jgi:transposase InsO family protein
MMDSRQFEGYCQQLELPETGRAYLQRVRSSPPSRRVNSRVGNNVCRFPSKKMGFVVCTESRQGELAAAYRFEHDPDVVEFYDQPEAIKLVYAARSGRMTGAMHTPDFLVLRRELVSWIEVKPEDRLSYLAEVQPNRYQRHVPSQWRCSPGEETAKSYGFSYEVLSTAEINRILVRNLEYLDDFYRDPDPKIPAEERKKVTGLIRERPGITIECLRQQLGAEVMDALFALIIAQEVYVDLGAQLISEQETARLFESEEVAKAWRIVGPDASGPSKANAPKVNGHELKNSLVAGTLVLPSNTPEQDQAAEPSPVRTGDVPNGNGSPDALALLRRASSKDIAIANERFAFLNDPGMAKQREIPERSLRRWRVRFRQAEELYGNGYVGLLPRYLRQGNHAPRLPPQVYELADQVIREVYNTPKRVSKMFVYGRFANLCQETGLPAPSYVWLLKAIRKLRAYEVKLAREGKRAAYSLEFTTKPLSAKNENHGDFPWQVVHIDHTQIDVELVDESTSFSLGRPWLTAMFDGFSRRVLCFVLSFDAPSVNTLKSILRECVRRHSRLPSGVTHDWGKEFGSEFFETLTAIYQVRHIKRPPHQSRHGSVIERGFKSLNDFFFHNLRANTQNTRNVRQLTKSMDPKRFAVWSLEGLYEHLSRFCFETYDQLLHSGIGTTPAEAFERGNALAGSRPWRRIEYDDTFKLLTMATTPKGTARIQPGLGVKIRYFYYWHSQMRDPQWERKEVPVRYDQDDLGVAYARIASQWVRCFSCHYDTLKGKTEKQLRLAVAALRQRRSLIEGNRTITARQIARFFDSVEGEEVIREQRMKDMARQRIVEAPTPCLPVTDARSAEHEVATLVQPAAELAPPPADAPIPSKGPVFDDF